MDICDRIKKSRKTISIITFTIICLLFISQVMVVVGSSKPVVLNSDNAVVAQDQGGRITKYESNQLSKAVVNDDVPLLDLDDLENDVYDSSRKYVVLSNNDKFALASDHIIDCDSYRLVIADVEDPNILFDDENVLKICDMNEEHLKNLVAYTKQILRAESEEKIKELKMRKSFCDVVEKQKLLEYMQADNWDVKPGQISEYQQFVTPDIEAIQQAVDGLTVEEIYDTAVNWFWVSDNVLNEKNEKWLLPYEFLVNTPNYDTNPSPGFPASDCSEQANTLVSMLRASGVSAEDVRVAIGQVCFEGETGGHAWVELKIDGKWMVLDPTCGPYFDSETNKIEDRKGVGFSYWKYHPYPVEEVWAYYNDQYYTDEQDEVASGWSNNYEVVTEEEILSNIDLIDEKFSPSLLVVFISCFTFLVIISIVIYRKFRVK